MSHFEKNGDGSDSSDDEGPSVALSAAALAALREFALDRGIASGEDDIIDQVRDHFDIKDKSEVFKVSYQSSNGERVVEFSCKGVA